MPNPSATPRRWRARSQRSGTFLEANLADAARGAADPKMLANDLKALMLTLSRTLRDSGARPSAAHSDNADECAASYGSRPVDCAQCSAGNVLDDRGAEQQLNELSRQTDGAIARLTTTQITNTAAGPGGAIDADRAAGAT